MKKRAAKDVLSPKSPSASSDPPGSPSHRTPSRLKSFLQKVSSKSKSAPSSPSTDKKASPAAAHSFSSNDDDGVASKRNLQWYNKQLHSQQPTSGYDGEAPAQFYSVVAPTNEDHSSGASSETETGPSKLQAELLPSLHKADGPGSASSSKASSPRLLPLTVPPTPGSVTPPVGDSTPTISTPAASNPAASPPKTSPRAASPLSASSPRSPSRLSSPEKSAPRRMTESAVLASPHIQLAKLTTARSSPTSSVASTSDDEHEMKTAGAHTTEGGLEPMLSWKYSPVKGNMRERSIFLKLHESLGPATRIVSTFGNELEGLSDKPAAPSGLSTQRRSVGINADDMEEQNDPGTPSLRVEANYQKAFFTPSKPSVPAVPNLPPSPPQSLSYTSFLPMPPSIKPTAEDEKKIALPENSILFDLFSSANQKPRPPSPTSYGNSMLNLPPHNNPSANTTFGSMLSADNRPANFGISMPTSLAINTRVPNSGAAQKSQESNPHVHLPISYSVPGTGSTLNAPPGRRSNSGSNKGSISKNTDLDVKAQKSDNSWDHSAALHGRESADSFYMRKVKLQGIKNVEDCDEPVWSTPLAGGLCSLPGGCTNGFMALFFPACKYGDIVGNLRDHDVFCGDSPMGGCIIFTMLMPCCLQVCLHYRLRRAIREKYQITEGSAIKDFATVALCAPCALAQEYNEVLTRKYDNGCSMASPLYGQGPPSYGTSPRRNRKLKYTPNSNETPYWIMSMSAGR